MVMRRASSGMSVTLCSSEKHPPRLGRPELGLDTRRPTRSDDHRTLSWCSVGVLVAVLQVPCHPTGGHGAR
jgi:hypothetical protein